VSETKQQNANQKLAAQDKLSSLLRSLDIWVLSESVRIYHTDSDMLRAYIGISGKNITITSPPAVVILQLYINL